MKIGVSSYSFSGMTRNGRMKEIECIAKAKEMGFDCIEFSTLQQIPEGRDDWLDAKRVGNNPVCAARHFCNQIAEACCEHWGGSGRENVGVCAERIRSIAGDGGLEAIDRHCTTSRRISVNGAGCRNTAVVDMINSRCALHQIVYDA